MSDRRAWTSVALRTFVAAVALAVALAGALVAPRVAFGRVDAIAASAPAPPRRSSVVVGVTDAAHMPDVRERLEALGGTVKRTYGWNAYLVAAPAGQDSVQFAARVRPLDGVKYAGGNATVHAVGTVGAALASAISASGGVSAAGVPNDPYYADQWGLPKIGAPTAWDAAKGAGVRIAVLDSGIDLTHADFAGGKVVDTTNTIVAGGPVQDDNGHGTHVAGIAAAVTDNAAYVAGTAPDAQLMIAKVLDSSGSGSMDVVAAAIRWAADNGADIISMSFGTSDTVTPDAMGDAVAYAQSRGCLVVAAAGNYPSFPLTERIYPAAYDGVVGAGSTDSNDVVSYFSLRGVRASGDSVVVLSAPGDTILSAGLLSLYPSGVVYMSGTSMAAPCVAGAAAVVWSRFPGESASYVLGRLTVTALDLGTTGRDTSYGYGRIRLDLAVDLTPPTTGSDAHASYADSALIRLTRSDNVGGSGVAHTYYTLDDVGGTGIEGTTIATSVLGSHTIEYWSVDYAGNMETPRKTRTFTVNDATPPATASDAKAAYGGSATVHLTASDNPGGSGVAHTYYTLDHAGGTGVEGTTIATSVLGSHTIEFWSTDSVGNVETPRKTASFTVGDITAPTTTSDAGVAYVGSALIHLTAQDGPGGSGVANTYYTLDGVTAEGTIVAMSSPGLHALEFWSVDVAGNTETPAKTALFSVSVPPPVATSISISSSASSVRLPRPFILTGVLAPGSVGDLCVVYVKKPGSWRWSYSSARLAYAAAPGGGANWWYRYTPKLRGYYYFYVRFAGEPLRVPSQSRTISVRIR